MLSLWESDSPHRPTVVATTIDVASMINSTFSSHLYNRVYSELTSRNSLSHFHMACSRLSKHIQPTTTEFASTGDLPSVK